MLFSICTLQLCSPFQITSHDVRFSLVAAVRVPLVDSTVPGADFKHLSRPEGGSQSQLISQSERPSQLLSRATQTGQLV